MAASLAKPDQLLDKDDYYHRLELASKEVTQDNLMRLSWINMMILRIESAEKTLQKNPNHKLHPVVRESLKNFCVIKVADRDEPLINEKKLFVIQKGTEMSCEAVPLSKTFPVVLKAHLSTEHGGVEEMNKWLIKSRLAVAPICLTTVIDICKNCPNKVTEDFGNSGVINILDMSVHGKCNSLSSLLIYQDMGTKFLQLRPISSEDFVVSIAIELTHLFSDIGPPKSVIVPQTLKKQFTQVIERLNCIFKPAIAMLLGDKPLVREDSVSMKLNVKVAMDNWMSETIDGTWCVGCYIVQWKLNNARGEDGISPHERVFGRSEHSNENSEFVKISVPKDITNEREIEDFISNNPVLKMPQ